MFQLFDINFQALIERNCDELYRLRKKTFSDRLHWNVPCVEDMETDVYDNPDTQYILGVCQEQLICSVRFIPVGLPNMITHTFGTLFGDIPLPENTVESSRFFVDKDRAKRLLGQHYPASYLLFLSMINYARTRQLDGICTIVSRPMLAILKRSGWQVKTMKEARLNVNELIYLLFLPVDNNSQAQMTSRVLKQNIGTLQQLNHWPLSLSTTKETV